MEKETKIKTFRMMFRDWLIGNIEDRPLLDFILNYGLSNEFKQTEETVRDLYGQEPKPQKKKMMGDWNNLRDML